MIFALKAINLKQLKMCAGVKIRFKKGFTLVELMVVIGIVGVLLGIVVVSMQAIKRKSRVVSFKSTATSINAAAISCAGESLLNVGNMTISADGTAVCTDANVEPANYPVLKAGVCDGNSYDAVATDDLIADDDYTLDLSCDIAGTLQTVSCTTQGCH